MTAVLEEKDAIHETIAEYCFHFDGGEFDKWVDLFTDDGVFDAGPGGVQKGKDALRVFLKNIRLTNGSPMVKHCVMNEVIKVNGDEATAKSYIVLVRSKGEGALVNGLAGRYEDQLVKQGDRWLFKNRKVHFDLMGDMR
jgi:ketosteroid isomerase-like protein